MEPERKIEKLLRAFAKKRREQAGDAVELRPAARQRLHGEIRRRSQQSGSGGFLSSLFAWSRPRLAFAFCILALVCVGVWVVLPLRPHEKSQQSLASINSRRSLNTPTTRDAKSSPAEPAPAPETPAPSAPQPVAAPPPEVLTVNPDSAGNAAAVVALENEKKLNYQTAAPAEPPPANRPEYLAGAANGAVVGGVRDGAAVDSSLAQNSFAPIVAPGAPGSAFNTNTLLDMNQNSPHTVGGALDKDAEQVATAAAAASAQKQSVWAAQSASAEAPATFAFKGGAATPPVGAVAFDSLAGEQGAPASQHFYRVDLPNTRDRAAVALRNPAPILTSFRVEQNGSQLRMLDADGSVYTGAVQFARDEKTLDDSFAMTLKTEAAAAKPVAQAPSPAQKVFFLVTGTNRNLKQMVTFSGNFIPLTNSILWTNTFLNGTGGAGGAAGAASEKLPLLLLNSRISGKAVIGAGKEIDVNAAPARR